MHNLKLLLLIILTSTFTSSAQIGAKLEYIFSVGDEYVLIQTSKQSVKQNLLGTEQIIENVTSGSMALKVIQLTPTGAVLEARYTTITMMMKLPQGIPTASFDSEGDSSKIENKVTKAMMNKPFIISLTKQGIIENIEGEQNLMSGFARLGLDSKQLSSIQEQFEQNFGERSIKSSFELVFINYSPNNVLVGDTWKNETGIEIMGINLPLQSENLWTVVSIEKEVSNLSSNGVISTINKEQVILLPNGLKSTVDLSGTQKIISAVNTSTGWPIEVKASQSIKGNVNFMAGNLTPADIQVPVEIESTSTFTLLKKIR